MASSRRRIAKTLSLRIGERVVLIVASGTSRWTTEGQGALRRQAEMLGIGRSRRNHGHEIAALPIRIENAAAGLLRIFAERRSTRWCRRGSTHSAVAHRAIANGRTVDAEWIDVCQGPGRDPGPIRFLGGGT